MGRCWRVCVPECTNACACVRASASACVCLRVFCVRTYVFMCLAYVRMHIAMPPISYPSCLIELGTRSGSRTKCGASTSTAQASTRRSGAWVLVWEQGQAGTHPVQLFLLILVCSLNYLSPHLSPLHQALALSGRRANRGLNGHRSICSSTVRMGLLEQKVL